MKYFCTKFFISTSDEAVLQAARELLADSAAECGYESFMDTDEGLEGYVQQPFYDESAISGIISDFPIEDVGITFQTESVEDQDWNETWETEQGFQPIYIDGKMLVFDSLHDTADMFSDVDIKIGIRARNAFGTGTHETTQMMLSSILSHGVEGCRLLDCGCGTGILGIAALKCGAAEAVGYDIDEWSADNARYNADANGVGEHFAVYQGDASVIAGLEGKFDVVVANINRNILLADMPAFVSVMPQGGTLFLSGFYSADVPLLVEKARSLGLVLDSQFEKNDWQCLRFVLG